jgi:hypothetical protein
VLDNGLHFVHYALMTGVHLRSGLLALFVAVPLALAAQSSPASAGCMSGALPSATVSGVVVSTSIDPNLGVIVDVKTGDGTTRQVGFWGRNPTNALGAVENTVEDAWAGSLPMVGGSYSITGDFNGQDKPITVSKCAQSPSVKVLSAPAASPPAEGDLGASDGSGMSTSAVVGLALGAVIVVVMLGLWLRRRTQPA